MRYLYGPIHPGAARELLQPQIERGDCLIFGYEPDSPIRVSFNQTWREIEAQFPPGWVPDAVVLYLGYTTVPEAFWSCPHPRIGLAQDWNLLWNYYCHVLPLCDLVLTDQPGVERFHRAGFLHVEPAVLYGCSASMADGAPDPGKQRPIDISFVGNLNPAVHQVRMRRLGEVAKLATRHRVAIRSGVYGAAYRELLDSSRIVFNSSVRGEANLRAFEAPARGALLFQDEACTEIQQYLTPGEDYVVYRDENLLDLLDQYLRDEPLRIRMARSAQGKLNRYRHSSIWEDLMQRAQGTLHQRTDARSGLATSPAVAALERRAWQFLNSPNPLLDAHLPSALQAAANQPHAAHLWSFLGAVLSRLPSREEASIQASLHGFAHDSADLTALHNAGWMASTHHPSQATALLRHLLHRLDAPHPSRLPRVPLLPAFIQHGRGQWEKAAWEQGGDPEGETEAFRTVLRWSANFLLASLTGEALFSRAVAHLAPTDPPSLLQLFHHHLQRRDISAARAVFVQLLEVAPFFPALRPLWSSDHRIQGLRLPPEALDRIRAVERCLRDQLFSSSSGPKAGTGRPKIRPTLFRGPIPSDRRTP